MDNSRIENLKSVPLFSSLDEDNIKEIAFYCKEKSYKKNEVIFYQEDKSNYLVILMAGQAKISLIDKNGKEAILKMVDQNDYFGEMSLLDGSFRSAMVTSVENSKVLLISRDDFLKLIRKYPDIALKMLVIFSRRLRKADEKIASLTFFDSYGKVAKVLLELIDSRGENENGYMVLNLSLSRQEVADMAGVSRETVTRVFHEFQIRGCLKVAGKKITIFKQALLEKELM